MDKKIQFSSIKNEPAEDPILSGPKLLVSEENILSRDVLKTALKSGESICSAEIKLNEEGRILYVHEVSYEAGTRFSLSDESIMNMLRGKSFDEKTTDEQLKAYMKAVSSVRCIQAFGGNMVPVSRFYYYYCELANMLDQHHTHTGL